MAAYILCRGTDLCGLEGVRNVIGGPEMDLCKSSISIGCQGTTYIQEPAEVTRYFILIYYGI